jgi:hypothetical protein
MYLYSKQREAVVDLHEYTHGIMRSYMELPYVKQLLNDEIYGKTSIMSSRQHIHRHLWPDIKTKIKLVGLEGDRPPAQYPDYINEFQKSMNSVFCDHHLSINEARKMFKL